MAPQLSTLPDVLAGSDGSPAILGGSGGPSFTRGELNALVIHFAESLRASGIKPGDVITIADANTVRGYEGLHGHMPWGDRPTQLHIFPGRSS